MSLGFLSLPGNAIDNVCLHLDDKSLMRMREVCKGAKAIVDESILSYRRTDVSELTLGEDIERNETRIEIWLSTSSDCCCGAALWRIAIFHACKMLEITDYKLGNYTTGLIIWTTEIGRLFGYLKLRTRRAIYYCLEVINAQPDLVRSCSYFLEGKRIRVVDINLRNPDVYDFSPLADLIQQVKASKISCNMYILTKDAVEFLLEMSKNVKSMTFSAETSTPYNTNVNLIATIPILLSQYCNDLFLTNGISLGDVEKLINIFHNMDKKISFKVAYRNEPLNVQIGTYKIRTNERLRIISINNMGIKH